MPKLRIATRQSPLALVQAETVATLLQQQQPELITELVAMTTKADQMLHSPLSKIGGKGLFVKELEQSLLSGDTDIAVHSMKDVPMALPDGLMLAAILPRADPADAVLMNAYHSLQQLPINAPVGTSSLRRQAQLRAHYPHLRIQNLRGSVGTRLQKLDKGEFAAIILAVAGLQRLALADRITQRLSPEECLPAVGQGAIGIECRADDIQTQTLLAGLNDYKTSVCVTAERAMNRHLNGGCQVPLAGFATFTTEDTLQLRGLVAAPSGEQILHSVQSANVTAAEALGIAVAEDLLSQGAAAILRAAGIEV